MNFKEILNNYINKLKCSSKDLSNESGLSQTVISRYRNGERIPNIESEQLNQLIDAIYKIAVNKNINIAKNDILNSFLNAINKNNFDYENFSKKFDELISSLKISIIEMSRNIIFDPSYISRIRTGQRKPAYPEDFVNKICNFVTTKYTTEPDLKNISLILKCEMKDLSNKDNYFNLLRTWLTNNSNSSNKNIENFLKNLDQFNLNDYIKSIKFDELKIPNIPFYRIKSKNYYGIEEMKLGELDFFKATILSKNKEPIFMCSDMPMEDMAKDIDFGKKWMFAIAMALKKGLHLNIIHNLDRPFDEMMLGLESWIPIYMTGQVSPYYLKDSKDIIYNHFNYVSGCVALSGEAIKGFHNKGKYYLTNNKKEIDYYKVKSECLLKKANPLMTIYKEENKNNFNIFLEEYEKTSGARHRIINSLPIFTIEDNLLISILKRNKINKKEISEILNYKEKETIMINNILKNNIIHDEVSNNYTLSLENIFYDKKITYTEDEYNKHLKSTEIFSKKNDNYKFNINNNNTFHNIQITSISNEFVIISKKTNPVIHFIIKHPKLRNAIENFSAPIKEDL